MYRLFGFFTQNSRKPLYVLEEIGANYEFTFVDLMQREHMSEEFKKKTPIGKVPVLEHDGEFLFESGAICRYVASLENSPLYPEDKLQRARVDQWMDFFSCHLGRWFSTLYFEQVIKTRADMGEPDRAVCEEAMKFANKQSGILDGLLGSSHWLANDTLSIADLSAFAYVEQYRDVDFPMDDFPNFKAWFDRIEGRESIALARGRLPS